MQVVFKVAAVALLGAAIHAQRTAGPHPFAFTSSVDNTRQSYGLYTPPGYEPSKKYPLLVALHSENTNDVQAVRSVFGRGNARVSDLRLPDPKLPDVEFLIASPQARGIMGYQGIPEHDVYDMLANIESHYSVDKERVYLTGDGMGG